MDARSATALVNCLVFVIATGSILYCYYFLHQIGEKIHNLIPMFPFITDLNLIYTELSSLILKDSPFILRTEDELGYLAQCLENCSGW